MPFRNENIAVGLLRNAEFQVGSSNQDDNRAVEDYVKIPWASNPEATYLYFDCAVGSMLDSGIVVHNRLPQVDRTPDTLASVNIEDPNLDRIVGPGVNLQCVDQYQDIVQRMGHSRYWFRLWGQALRVGHRVPIPSLKSIGGVPTIPYDRNPQWAFNRIAPGGNFSGVILWHAQWSLWYTTAVPPKSNQIPEVDPAAHINGRVVPPDNIQASHSQADSNAEVFAQRIPNAPNIG